jgi:CHASE1-domain containing sensor protein
MRKFNWQTMLIFIVSLLLAVVLLGLATAHIAKLKQQRRQLSDNGTCECVDLKLRLQPTTCAWPFWGSAGFSRT